LLHDGRVELVANQVRALFGTAPDSLDEFVYASQACQAEALKFFIEFFRAGKWRRTGILWWNLIDGWPQISDAVVDYYFRRKRAYETVKRVQAPLHLVLREQVAGGHELVAVNDNRADVALEYRVTDLESGRTLAEGAATGGGDAVTSLARVAARDAQALYLLDWTSAAGPGRSHYLAGRPPFALATYRAWIAAAQL
jgi:beta-mannosidase